MKRPVKILLGLVLGTILGIVCHLLAPAGNTWLDWTITSIAQPMGQIFLRLIFMIVVPLVFSSLVLGVFELGDITRLGKVGVKTLIYTIFSSFTAVLIGLLLVGWLKPGSQLDPELLAKAGIQQTSANVIAQANSTKSLPDILVALIPKNPLYAAVNALEGEMVALMVFALIFGVALVLARPGQTEDPFIKVLETVRDTCLRVVDFAMALAPFGVAALMFALTAKFGWGLMFSLGKYVGVVILGLLIQQFVVFGAILKFYAKKSPIEFLRQIREVIITAFSTASSNATLPTALRAADKQLGIEPGIGSFVLTVGSTANQNGTALFEGVTILFLAQVFGVDLSIGQQVVVLVMSVIAGVGTAGVPGGSIPLIVIVLQSVGIPAEGIGIILGVDRLLDMCRTVLNVTGDLVAAYVINYSEHPNPGTRRT